jgi:hypothetical protein
MRLSLLLVAAFLAFAAFTPQAAYAFDVQTLSGANADGSAANLSDPDDAFEKNPLNSLSGLPSSSSLKFGMGIGTGTPVQSFREQGADNGWQFLQPGGRLTH